MSLPWEVLDTPAAPPQNASTYPGESSAGRTVTDPHSPAEPWEELQLDRWLSELRNFDHALAESTEAELGMPEFYSIELRFGKRYWKSSGIRRA